MPLSTPYTPRCPPLPLHRRHRRQPANPHAAPPRAPARRPALLQLEPYPELRRYNGFAAAFESAFGGWVALVTLPSMALGALAGPLSALAHAQAARLPPAAVRYGPAAASALLLPLLLPACAQGAEWTLAFAVRPTVDSNRPPVTRGGGYTPDYEAPSGDELLLGLGSSLPDLDPADRARLRWALDGDAASPYPGDDGGGGGGGQQRAAVGGGAPLSMLPPAPPASSADDAAFLASLHALTARRRQQAFVSTRLGDDPSPPPTPNSEETDFDRLVASAVDGVTGGRLSRARSAAAAAAAVPAGGGAAEGAGGRAAEVAAGAAGGGALR